MSPLVSEALALGVLNLAIWLSRRRYRAAQVTDAAAREHLRSLAPDHPLMRDVTRPLSLDERLRFSEALAEAHGMRAMHAVNQQYADAVEMFRSWGWTEEFPDSLVTGR